MIFDEPQKQLSPILEESQDVNLELRKKALIIIQHYSQIKEEWD
jgi:hypothetical protein